MTYPDMHWADYVVSSSVLTGLLLIYAWTVNILMYLELNKDCVNMLIGVLITVIGFIILIKVLHKGQKLSMGPICGAYSILISGLCYIICSFADSVQLRLNSLCATGFSLLIFSLFIFSLLLYLAAKLLSD